MGNHTNLLFYNDTYGTVLITIDETEEEIGCITTKPSSLLLTLARSSIFCYFELDKKKQIKEFENLMYRYAPVGRAFLGSYSYFMDKKEREIIRNIKDLTKEKEYYICDFGSFVGDITIAGPLIYKGIFPGTLGDFYDLYKETMFEETFKAAKIINKYTERELRAKFNSMLEKGVI